MTNENQTTPGPANEKIRAIKDEINELVTNKIKELEQKKIEHSGKSYAYDLKMERNGFEDALKMVNEVFERYEE